MDSSRNSLLEALKQVERRTENSASGWRLLFYFVALIPVIAAFARWFFGLSAYFPLPLLILTCSIVFLSLGYSTYETKRVRHMLEKSPLAVRIAGGELIDDPIFAMTPIPWRSLLPGGGSINPNINQVIHRVAWNLDWYAHNPRPLRRIIWVYQPLAAIVGSLAVIVLLLPRLLGFQHHVYSVLPYFVWQAILYTQTNPKWVSTLLAALCFSSIAFIHYRRQIWTEELVRHLRERLLA